MNTTAYERARAFATRSRAALGVGTGFFAKSKESRGELYIYEPIGGGWFGGVTAKAVVEELKKLEGKKTLDVYINSEGGDVFEAKAIYENLRRFEAKKTVHVDGLAASAATFVAMAGDKIITSASGTWMIHEVWTIAMGNASDLRDAADVIEKENDALAGIYARRNKKLDEKAIMKLMKEETWMNAKEALENGFSDETEEEQPAEEAAALSRPLLAAYGKTPEPLLGKRAAVAARLAKLDVSLLKHSRRASPTTPGQPGSTK